MVLRELSTGATERLGRHRGMRRDGSRNVDDLEMHWGRGEVGLLRSQWPKHLVQWLNDHQKWPMSL